MDDDEPQTAMMMTQQEWEDLAHIVDRYMHATDWAAQVVDPNPEVSVVLRRRKLAQRITDAA